jgi:hypothetical protein
MHILLRKRIGTYLKKIKDYQKANFGIWELHPKIIMWSTYLYNKVNNPKFLYNKVNNPKFLFNYTKLSRIEYVKNVFI